MEMKSTLKTLMGIGEKENAIPMELKSTMKTLLGLGVKENTIPMEMKSTMNSLTGIGIKMNMIPGNLIYWENSYGEIIDNRPKGCEGKVVEIDGKKYKLISE